MHWIIQALGQTGPDRVEVYISHGSEQSTFVAKNLTLESPFPEPPFTTIFSVGAACDRLSEAAHEP